MRRSELLDRFQRTAWADALLGLLEGVGDDWQDAYHRLISGVWDQGTVDSSAPGALDALVTIAEQTRGARASTSLAVALLVATGDSADETTLVAVRRELAALAPRLQRLSAAGGLSGELAAACSAQASAEAGDAPTLERAEHLVAAAERALAAECTAAEQSEGRAPEALTRALEQCRFDTPQEEASALGVAFDCLAVARYADALRVCTSLVHRPLLGERYRIEALVGLGRLEEAKRRATALAHAWLAPATGADAASQVLLQGDVLAPLRAILSLAPDGEVAALVARVEAAPPNVFIPEGDFF